MVVTPQITVASHSDIQSSQSSMVINTELQTTHEKEDEEVAEMILQIDGREIDVKWENNETVQALMSELENGNISIVGSAYAGFEQVASLGKSYVSSNQQMTTEPGDIVLYSGNALVFFYGSNSWSYTKVGKMVNLTNDEITHLLNKYQVEITLSLKNE